MNKRLLANFFTALEAVAANRIRSILTALGIIFGVAAVIAMLAIGSGAQKEILDQIKLVGVNNIVINPIVEQSEDKVVQENGKSEKQKFSQGLNMHDVNAIKDIIPNVNKVSPEIILQTHIIKSGLRRSAKLIGVTPDYFKILNFNITNGNMFNEAQLEKGLPVCIIGNGVKAKFFPAEDPIGKTIKCGKHWLEVVGVMDKTIITESDIDKLGIRNYNMDVYTPINTMLIRYRNRALITKDMLRFANQRSRGRTQESSEDEEAWFTENYHQIDKLVVQVDRSGMMAPVADVMTRMLKRRHNNKVDFEITIPELLLKQEQRTKKIFNIVLFAIAAISLLVGGIGIMNIMLASVLERIKEIGLRISLGAKKNDIISQFLFESMMISVSGGLIGIILGVTLAFLVSNIAEIPTIITFSSIVISFGVAASVGLIFGLMPARRAAKQDPITSLRYE